MNDWVLGMGLMALFGLTWIIAALFAMTDEPARMAAMEERRRAPRTTLGLAIPPALFDRRAGPGWRRFRRELVAELRRASARAATPVETPPVPAELSEPLPPLYLYRVAGIEELADTMVYGWAPRDGRRWFTRPVLRATPEEAVLKVRANEAMAMGVLVEPREDAWRMGPTPAGLFEFSWTLAEARERL